MKIKVVLIIGYNGKNYSGLQFNKNAYTLEGKILEILLKEGCITELNAEKTSKVGMTAASRTDKGVSASFNVIQVKIIKELNDSLKELLKRAFEECNIKLYDILRVPNSFISHNKARSREYKYFLPTFVLKPHQFLMEPEFTGHEEKKAFKIQDVETYTSYRSNPDQIEYFTQILKLFEGTHNFHNFTISSNDKATQRHLRKLSIERIFTYDNVEYAEILLHGNSFIIHQIRKMITFAVINCRYERNFEKIKENFSKVFSDEKFNIAKAPGEYLMLSSVKFDDYNSHSKYGKIEVLESLKKEFEEEQLHQVLMAKENLTSWLILFTTITFHHENFSYLK